MQIKNLPGSKIFFEVKTTDAQFQKAKAVVLTRLNQETKVDGFRKGHVPEEVLIKKSGGTQVLEQRILDLLLSQSYAEVVKNENLQVIAHPELEIVQKNPLVYKVKVDVYPEVILPDYQKIKAESKEVKVTKKEVEEWVENFRKQLREFKEVDRKAQKDDRVEIDFEGFSLEGVPLENTKSQNHPLVLGENTFIPGFEEEVIGMKKGDEKEFKITFPKDYHVKQFANRQVKFKVKLNLVTEPILPELNEEFVKKITGTKKSLGDFKKEIEENLLKKKKQEEKTRRENQWIEKVMQKTKSEIPASLIAEEVDFMVDEIKMQGLSQGIPWEKHLEHLKKTEDDLKIEFKSEAEKRVKTRLTIQAILKQEKIQVEDQEVETVAKKMIQGQPPQNKERYQTHYAPSSKGFLQLKNQMLLEKMFAKVLS